MLVVSPSLIIFFHSLFFSLIFISHYPYSLLSISSVLIVCSLTQNTTITLSSLGLSTPIVMYPYCLTWPFPGVLCCIQKLLVFIHQTVNYSLFYPSHHRALIHQVLPPTLPDCNIASFSSASSHGQ